MKKILYEVTVIRPIAFMLILVFHSFCPWGGNWSDFNCYSPNDSYLWINRFSSGFHLEIFVFISGYVYAYQSYYLKRNSSFIAFTKNKFKRLWRPAIIFGIIYYFLFIYDGTFNVFDFTIKILGGTGHLWFLPMLFWCFIGVKIINYTKLSPIIFLIFLSALSIIPCPIIYMRVTHFLFYFYLGYVCWVKKDNVFNSLGKRIVEFAILLITCYVILVFMMETTTIYLLGSDYPLIIVRCILGFIKMVMAISGIMGLYLLIYRITNNNTYECPRLLIHLGSVSFGIYIFHQFILKYIYYYTNLPCLLGEWLPWAGLFIAFSLSYLLTIFFLRFKLGRSLIG